MKRLLVVLGAIGVTACGAPTTPHFARSRPREATPVAPHGLEATSTTTAVMPSRSIDASAIVDTSIATVWAAPPPPQSPPPAESTPRPARAEPEPVARRHPRARAAGRRAPCFPKRDVLVGDEIWRDLSQYAVGMSSARPPSTRYGTCTITDGQLRDANGTLLAELHCGISVYAPGIVDHLGFEVGARGSEVAAAHVEAHREVAAAHDEAHRAVAAAHDEAHRELAAQHDPRRPLTPDAMCWAEGDQHTRCWIESGDDNEAGSHYVFAATTPMPERGPLKEPHARTFFTSHTVASFTVRITCH